MMLRTCIHTWIQICGREYLYPIVCLLAFLSDRESPNINSFLNAIKMYNASWDNNTNLPS